MHTHVYANGLEIACKAAGNDGVSPSAFPDPCWSPPPPKAGPVVIPYPNTCYATSITNGTSTISICGKEVAIEDKSRFDTSTGNEPATHAFRKGVRTGVITGKAYFTQWSMDVVFEGFGVPRHTDLVGHNHGSMPSNTPLFPYLSRAWRRSCADERKRIGRACEPESEQSETRKALRKKSPLSDALSTKRKASVAGKATHWTDDHCDGLQVNLGGTTGVQNAKEYASDMQQVFQKLPDELRIISAMRDELESLTTEAGARAAAKWAAKAGLKQTAGTSVPLAGNILMAIWSAVDGVMAIGDVREIRRSAAETLGNLDVLKDRAQKLVDVAESFKNFSELSPEEQAKTAQRLSIEGQTLLAELNPCTRARKCSLVPKSKKDGSRNVETADGKGCCKGQTGHHLINDAMVRDSGCKDYNYGTAPTVCVEGFNQHFGSHAKIHDRMDKMVAKLIEDRQARNTMSMTQAIDAAVATHNEVFRTSLCDPGCIRAQLQSYYKCPQAELKIVDKNGNQVRLPEEDVSNI